MLAVIGEQTNVVTCTAIWIWDLETACLKYGLRFNDKLNNAKIERFWMEARKLHPPETNTRGRCRHWTVGNKRSGKILRTLEHSSWLLNRKALSYGRLKICKITRVCLENKSSVTARQSVFFPYKSGLLIFKIFKNSFFAKLEICIIVCTVNYSFPFLKTSRDQLWRTLCFRTIFQLSIVTITNW